MVVPQIFTHLSRQHLDFGVNLKIYVSFKLLEKIKVTQNLSYNINSLKTNLLVHRSSKGKQSILKFSTAERNWNTELR